jgi:hypothetical protein
MGPGAPKGATPSAFVVADGVVVAIHKVGHHLPIFAKFLKPGLRLIRLFGRIIGLPNQFDEALNLIGLILVGLHQVNPRVGQSTPLLRHHWHTINNMAP